jgi:hypothetical protein
MAQVDIKNARLYFKDGYAGPGGSPLVDLMAGYMSGTTTIAVDGFIGEVVDGDLFTIAGETGTPVHTVVSSMATLGNTTEITFSPSTVSSISDDAVITMLPHQLEITIGEGNFSWTEKHAREYKLNRGRLDKVRDGNEDPLEIKTEFTWEHYKASTGAQPTPVDVLDHTGEASDWVTSGSDPCEPYCVDVVLVYTPICDTEQLETLTFPEFRHEQRDFDLTKGTGSLSGKCNVTKPTAVRSDQ